MSLGDALRGLPLLALCFAAPALAEVQYRSVLFQNDFFLGRDGGGYTNGIFLSAIRTTSADEAEVAPSALLRPMAPALGLPRATLVAWSLGQVTVTPADITRSVPDPDDAPYAGALMLRSAQVDVNDDIAELLAVSVGVMGPASGAAQTQRIVHRVIGADEPHGWSTQVGNRPLFGIERYRARRFPVAARGDLTVLGGGSLGNLESSAGLGVLLRYGDGLEQSFPAVARLSVRSADPVLIGRGWFGFASFSADVLFNHIGIRRDAAHDGPSLRKTRLVAVAGFAHGWGDASVSLSLQRASPVSGAVDQVQTFGSITWTFGVD